MMTMVVALALLPTVAAWVATARPRHAAVRPAAAAATMLDVNLVSDVTALVAAASDADLLKIAADLPAAEQAGGLGEALSVLWLAGALGGLVFIMDDEGMPDDTSKDDGQKTVQPGWLTCDMRVPLPDYSQLEEACHLLNTIDGCAPALCMPSHAHRHVRSHPLTITALPSRRQRWWLCAAQGSYESCEPSPDFSDFYKRPVYVCRAE